MNLNELEIESSKIGAGIIDPEEYQYIDPELNIDYRTPRTGKNANLMYSYQFYISDKCRKNLRHAYNLLDALGEIGGLAEALFVICGTLLSPFYFQI